MSCYLQLQRMMGQQSLSGFLGLHVDIDEVFADNQRKQGVRKYGCVLINQGDKLTPQQKLDLVERNRKRYALKPEYIKNLKLPAGCDVKVFSVSKITNARKKFSVVEQITYLLSIQKNLEKKLGILDEGRVIEDYTYLLPAEFDILSEHKKKVDTVDPNEIRALKREAKRLANFKSETPAVGLNGDLNN